MKQKLNILLIINILSVLIFFVSLFGFYDWAVASVIAYIIVVTSLLYIMGKQHEV